MTAGKRKFVSAVLGVLAVACGASFALTGAGAAEEPQAPSAESFALAGCLLSHIKPALSICRKKILLRPGR